MTKSEDLNTADSCSVPPREEERKKENPKPNIGKLVPVHQCTDVIDMHLESPPPRHIRRIGGEVGALCIQIPLVGKVARATSACLKTTNQPQ